MFQQHSEFFILSVPLQNQPGFKEYGTALINILAGNFHQRDQPESKTRKTEKMYSEWQSLKYHINDVPKPVIPEDGYKYNRMASLAAAAVVIPFTIAWPERGASCLKKYQNKIKEQSRGSNTSLQTICCRRDTCTNDCARDTHMSRF